MTQSHVCGARSTDKTTMDIKTLLVIGAAILLAAFVAMLVVLLSRKTYPGFGWWTSAIAFEVAGTLFYLFRPQGIDWVNGLIVSCLMVGCQMLIGRGTLVFRQRQVSFRLELGVVLSYLLLFGVVSVIYPDANARVALYSLYLGAGALLAMYWVLSTRPVYFSSSDLVLAAGLLIQGLAAIARAAYSVGFQPEVVNNMLNSHFQAYFLVIQVVTAMLLPLAFINMNALRIESDLCSTQEQLQVSLASSEHHRVQMLALNEMNEGLLACRHLDEAKQVIASSLDRLFGPGGASFSEEDAAQEARAAGDWIFPLRMRERTLGVLRVHVNSAWPGDALETWQTLATTVSDSIQLALSHLALEDELRTQAMRDALTGLFNRRYLDEVLTRELERCRRQGETFTAAMLDLDHFKQMNDCFGHEAGDEVLRVLGRTLQHWARASDIVCRYGGEEFTLVLQGATPAEIPARLEDLRQRIAGMQVVQDGRVLPPITVSIGVAQASSQFASATELLSPADGALYLAKQQGRNCVVASPD